MKKNMKRELNIPYGMKSAILNVVTNLMGKKRKLKLISLLHKQMHQIS